MALQRPMLLPGLPHLWRDPHTLQLGGDPARAVLLDLPDRSAATLLGMIDGTRTERMLFSQAARRGIPEREARALLTTLHEAGLVVAAPALMPPGVDQRLLSEASALAHQSRPAGGRSRSTPAPPSLILRRRAAAVVRIVGEGRLAPGIALALAEAGVGHLDLDLPGEVTGTDLPGSPLRAADLGESRVKAVSSALLSACPKIKIRPVRRTAATLHIQLRFRQPVQLLAAALSRRRQPHLTVTIREGVAVIGPFVPATGKPCLQCIDLHRRDRDPGWSDPIPPFEPCTVATLLSATAYAASEALAHIDGNTPETTGATSEISSPGNQRRRTWPPHPSCPCHRQRP